MANIAMELFVKGAAEKILDDFVFNGKTIREWAELLSSGEAVEVVRCKDCKHYMEYPLNKVDKRMCCYVHLLTPHFMPEDGFCSYGERREGE